MMNSMMRWLAQRLQRTDRDASKDEFRSNDHCSACHASLDAEPQAPMLIDATWGKLAAPQETLCAACMLDRAIKRRVDLTVADLVPCEFNRWGSPSWFDLFSQLR